MTINLSPTQRHHQVRNDIAEYRREAREILDRAGNNDLTGVDATRFDELAGLIETRQQEDRELSTQHSATLARIREGIANGTMMTERGSPGGDFDRDPLADPRDGEARFRGRDPWDLTGVNEWGRTPAEVAGELRSRALSAVEKMTGTNDRVREAATKILEDCDSPDGKVARHALLTSSPAYMRAWSKLARSQPHTLSPEESQAVERAEHFRAMSLTDSAGGYLVPFQLDPAVIITSSGSRNDIRSVARQVIATGDTWNGVSAAAVSWSWDAEAAEVSDDTPTFAQPSIPIYKAQGFVPVSIEAFQDAANVTAEVGKLFVFGKEALEAEAFITGTGSGQPTGIVTALAASAGGASIVNAATDDTFALSDVYSLQGALPARYRANATWLGNNLIYNKIRQFDTAGGGAFWANLNDGRPPQLLGRSAIEAEAMDGTITTSGAVANYILIFGDLSSYVIADRLGMTVELIPHLFGASRRPTGQRGWVAWYRVGADSVNDGGMRMLNAGSAS